MPPLAKFIGFGAKFLVCEVMELLVNLVDLSDNWPKTPHVAGLLVAEYAGEEVPKHAVLCHQSVS